MIWELRERLEQVARRIRSLRLSAMLTLCWLTWTAIGGALLWLAPLVGWNASESIPILASLATFTAVVAAFLAMRSARDSRTVALRVESRHPELASLLLTAVEQTPDGRGRRLGFLQHAVVRDAVEHGRAHDWTRSVAAWKVWLARLANVATFGTLIAVCALLGENVGANVNSRGRMLSGGDGVSRDFEVEIEPGNTEIERGTSLLVVAKFRGAMPRDAQLIAAISADVELGAKGTDSATVDGGHLEAKSADGVDRYEMARTLDDPQFVGRIAAVDRELTYVVEAGEWRSDEYRVRVFEYPELVRADAKLAPPEYTGLETTVVEDVRKLTAVEGTMLTLVCRLNKEVTTARLVSADGREVELDAGADAPQTYSASWTLAETERFKLHLVDRDGRKNRLPPEIVINVTPNRAPKIVIERPGRDVDVSPLEELQLAASVTDDYGVLETGVSFALGGEEPTELTLALAGESSKKGEIDHLFALETLEAEPDQMLSYFIWASDIGADGQPRRTMSDMFFAEVCHFEEILRQGEQPPGGAPPDGQQQGGSQQATELAELQKQIINGTWNLIRRVSQPKPTAEQIADAKVLRDSQQSAIERADDLAERLQDAESRGHLEAAREQMERSAERLTSAAGGAGIESLRTALAAERSAYQALLKLRAREFQVVQGNPQQQGGNAGGRNSRSQRQLDQLELKADENRYETQSRATSPAETRSQQESREILDRLREMARRQDDLNERLKELQSALDLAETKQARRELERELKRLREQQQDILRDSDELLSQMDQAQNRGQMEQAREEAAQSRSHLQQASEALEEGRLSQALTEGTRAGRQLNQLRDEFRRQAANRFSEEMTEMRREARDLDDQQRRLSEQLSESNSQPGRSLRDTGERAELQKGLAEQRRRLDGMLDEMQETIEEAEQPEPLLAQQLYDTVRDAHQQKVDDALEVARRLAEIGIQQEAGEAMQAAGRGIGRLRQGVERAAESVLGDETAALERARREVERLAEELAHEIQRSEPDDGDPSGGGDGESRPPVEEEEGGVEGEGRGAVRRDRQSEPQGGGRAAEDSSNEQEGQEGNESDAEQASASSESGAASDESGRPDSASRNGNRRPSSLRGGQESGYGRGGREVRRGAAANDDDDPLGRFFNDDGRDTSTSPSRGPITGEGFREWVDRIRDVEEMLDDEDLRAAAAGIRDRAEEARAEFKRHAKPPAQAELEQLVAAPLNELGQRIAEEIRRRESPDSLVPIDRDPIPPEFAESVRRYHERLGSGE